MNTALWTQTTQTEHAVIFRVNDQYRFQIMMLWRHLRGHMVPGPLLHQGFAPTLEEAKRQVFEVLE